MSGDCGKRPWSLGEVIFLQSGFTIFKGTREVQFPLHCVTCLSLTLKDSSCPQWRSWSNAPGWSLNKRCWCLTSSSTSQGSRTLKERCWSKQVNPWNKSRVILYNKCLTWSIRSREHPEKWNLSTNDQVIPSLVQTYPHYPLQPIRWSSLRLSWCSVCVRALHASQLQHCCSLLWESIHHKLLKIQAMLLVWLQLVFRIHLIHLGPERQQRGRGAGRVNTGSSKKRQRGPQTLSRLSPAGSSAAFTDQYRGFTAT